VKRSRASSQPFCWSDFDAVAPSAKSCGTMKVSRVIFWRLPATLLTRVPGFRNQQRSRPLPSKLDFDGAWKAWNRPMVSASREHLGTLPVGRTRATGVAAYTRSGRQYRPRLSTLEVLISQALYTLNGQQASDLRKHCARGGTRTGFHALTTRHSPNNIRNPVQSGTSTTRSEAQGVHNVHTSFLPALAPPIKLLKRTSGRSSRVLRAISLRYGESSSGTGPAPNKHRPTGRPSYWKSTNITAAGSSFPNVSWRSEQQPACPTDRPTSTKRARTTTGIAEPAAAQRPLLTGTGIVHADAVQVLHLIADPL
jgi:hypothetical protein